MSSYCSIRKGCLITGWSAVATGKRDKIIPVCNDTRYFLQEASTTYKEFPIPTRMPPMCDIKVSVVASSIVASIELWYDDEEKEKIQKDNSW